MRLRQLQPIDYDAIISVLNRWWGGRHVSDMLPKLFFNHFHPTSWVIEAENRPIAFLVGFISPGEPEESYIHFVGIHPEYRRQGLGRRLYQAFFQTASDHGCRRVRCLTSPINKRSIAFHRSLGFQLVPSQTVEEDLPIHKDYDGPGRDRVLFVKEL
ncbi:MAG: GNAT family N-acetyltransferase [Firmicutes bacterium]|nr:GNAT family N-acetyltransferase [Bacillota bacterium]